MKKIIFTVFIILSAVNIYTQEMTLSGGYDFGGGVFSVDNNFWFNSGSNYYIWKEKTNSAFFAPGISFTVRVFPDTDSTVSRGFVFRARTIFITNAKTSGTWDFVDTRFSYNNESGKTSETSSILDDELTSIMDFGLGSSTRYKISDRLQFVTDFGVNFTWMDSEDYETESTLDYLGAGIFSDVAFQINFTTNLYLELGLNSIINIFSSQEGNIQLPEYNFKTKYEDTGRLDLISATFYIQIGWRFDLKKKL